MVQLLKQGQYQPMDVIDQVLSIYAGTRGHLDKVPLDKVDAWEKGFHQFMREQKSEIRRAIVDSQKLDDDVAKQLEAAIAEFQKQFAAGKK